MKPKTISIKMVVLGDPLVGKSSITQSYINNKAMITEIPTLGMEFGVKELSIQQNEKSFDVKLQIFDVAGYREYLEVRKQYLFGTKAAIVVFDVTNPMSFDHIEDWISELLEVNNCLSLPILVLGNKTDLIQELENTGDELIRLKLNDLHKKHNRIFSIHYFRTSAITGHNIPSAFETVVRAYLSTTRQGK